MIIKRFAILISLLLASLGGLGQPSVSYPKSKGVVSDYAGKLSKAQINELAGVLKDYERKTSIEFVVVVIDSLHGQPVGTYTINLANFWKVGKVGRDNGIVLLWAPNERAYSLRIADGLKADLSDSDAKEITQQSLVPNFKRGWYYVGLKETVQATMAKLGDKTLDERAKARVEAAEREQQAQAQLRREQDRNTAEALRFIGGILLVAAIGAVASFAFYRWRERRKKLAELAQASAVIAENLSKAEANAPQVQKLLDDFSKEAPEQDLTAQRAELAAQPDRIVKLRLDATLLNFTDLKSYDEMLGIKDAAQAEGSLLETMQGRIGDIRAAKKESLSLMDRFSRETFAISDVRDSSRRNAIDQLLLRSRQDYELARQNSSMSVVDWLMINEMLDRSRNQVQQAVTYSQEAPYVSPTLSSYSDNSSSSGGGFFSSSDSSSSSSSSSSGSSDFGGGGGFSGGSGSDGSY